MNWKDTLIAEQEERERQYEEERLRRETQDRQARIKCLSIFLRDLGIEQEIESEEVEIDGVTFCITEQQYKYIYIIRASQRECPQCHAKL